MGFDTATLRGRKEKRWAVYSKAHYTLSDSTGTRQIFCDTIYGRNEMVSGSTTYPVIASPPREAWVLEGVYQSFQQAKAKVVSLAGDLGLDNVKLDRVVDLYTVLYPIS